MPDHPPVSVLVPTVRWTSVIEDVAAQLGPDDELFVICDNPDDPVAERASKLPEGVRLVVAGEPEECSGKANAIAAGMETASHERIVWTDDDFEHPPGWFEGLQKDYERVGSASEVPLFVGRDPLALLLEPVYVMGATLGLHVTGKAWGGAVIFERDDLPDEEAFVRDLRRSVSDDGHLSEALSVTSRRRTRRVEIGGTIRESLERHARFMQILWRHAPLAVPILAVLAVLGTIGGLTSPLRSILLSTLSVFGVYAYFGVWRWTLVLAYPAFLLNPILLAYGLGRRTFVWGGRRYRWRGRFDVEVVE